LYKGLGKSCEALLLLRKCTLWPYVVKDIESSDLRVEQRLRGGRRGAGEQEKSYYHKSDFQVERKIEQ